VIAAPNCFGDIISDIAGVLLGGRGLTFGASYSAEGAAVYQTNHGAAYDLAGAGVANPLGHILAMSMMLRQSYHLGDAADAVEAAVAAVLGRGVRTADIATTGSRIVSTGEMADEVCSEVRDGRGPDLG
jgi:3-isopropylmalate dehydrogenase